MAIDLTVVDLGRNGVSTDDILAQFEPAEDPGPINKFINDGRIIVLCRNTGVGAVTVTVTSITDPFGRIQDEVVDIAASEISVLPNLFPLVWNDQADSKVTLTANTPADTEYLVLRVPFSTF